MKLRYIYAIMHYSCIAYPHHMHLQLWALQLQLDSVITEQLMVSVPRPLEKISIFYRIYGNTGPFFAGILNMSILLVGPQVALDLAPAQQ